MLLVALQDPPDEPDPPPPPPTGEFSTVKREAAPDRRTPRFVAPALGIAFLIVHLVVVVRVWRESVPLGLVMVVMPLAALYAFFRQVEDWPPLIALWSLFALAAPLAFLMTY
jgi:hypothetical protein